VKVIDLPTQAEVHCIDGPVGRSTYIIGNPTNHEVTHLVVKSDLPPFREYLVPVDFVEETTPERIKLKCTRDNLYQMQPFEIEVYIRTEIPGYIYWSNVAPVPGDTTQAAPTSIPVRQQNIPVGEIVLQRGSRVEATDGYVGQVYELLINSKNMQVIHIVLLERHFLRKKEITIPVSLIERVDDDTVYLTLDRQSIRELPTTPKQRWPREGKEIGRVKKRFSSFVEIFNGLLRRN
jgi:sporulation protein YlmC with PRC-barrel domain